MSSQSVKLPIVQLTEHSCVPLENGKISTEMKSSGVMFLNARPEDLFLGDVKESKFPFGEEQPASFEIEKSQIKVNYHIGVDWLIPEQMAIRTIPKVNDEQVVDIASLLREALEDPDNLEHLKDLLYIDFQAKPIPLNCEDGLNLFVIIAFVSSVQQILKRGLKKSFYDCTESLKFKLKGKVGLTKTLSRTKTKPIIQNVLCRYQDFGVDIPENQLIKAALKVSLRLVRNQTVSLDLQELEKSLNQTLNFFGNVSDVSRRSLSKNFQVNPFFKAYQTALRLARMVLKLERYSDLNIRDGVCQNIPAYWINMPKLFELYVYKKLKEAIGNDGMVVYHAKAHRQELDFLAKSSFPELPYFIADAKYKPRYFCSDINKEDARQLAGYARLTKVVRTLENWGMKNEDRTIPCLVIYPEKTADTFLELKNIQPIDSYVKFYKLGIKLPVVKPDFQV